MGSFPFATPPTGFANPMSAAGDLIDGGTSGVPARLPIGTTGQVLTVAGGVPSWAAASAGFANPMTTAGDLIDGGTAGAAQRLAIGTSGQVLTVVSGAPAWAAATATPYDAYTAGSILAQTYPRWASTNNSTSLVTSQTYCLGIGLPAGLVITNVGLVPAVAGATQTHGWVALLNSSFTVLAVSTDQLGTNMFPTTNVLASVALSSPYTITANGFYYLVICQTASTVFGAYLINDPGIPLTPTLACTRGTQATPPTVSSTLGSSSSNTSLSYGFVS